MAALIETFKKGATSKSVTLLIIAEDTGIPDSTLVWNETGIDLWYRRQGAARVAITEATLASLTTGWTSGGFLTIDDGEYRLDVPDLAFVTGADWVDIGGTITGFIVIGGRVKLTEFDMSGTEGALLAASAGKIISGVTSGTPTTTTCTTDLNYPLNELTNGVVIFDDGQRAKITSNTAGPNSVLTFGAIATAVASVTDFVIV